MKFLYIRYLMVSSLRPFSLLIFYKYIYFAFSSALFMLFFYFTISFRFYQVVSNIFTFNFKIGVVIIYHYTDKTKYKLFISIRTFHYRKFSFLFIFLCSPYKINYLFIEYYSTTNNKSYCKYPYQKS